MNAPVSESVRQIIVVRADLNMPPGKLAAQAAHASVKAIVDLGKRTKGPGTPFSMVDGRLHIPERRELVLELTEALQAWLDGLYTKICVRVGTEAELLGVYEAAKVAGLPCALIEDAGLTVFKVPTKTCCAIGPASRSALAPITGHLALL